MGSSHWMTGIILIIIVGGYLLDLFLDTLNVMSWREGRHTDAHQLFDVEKYARARAYGQRRFVVTALSSWVETLLLAIFLILGGFAFIDGVATSLAAQLPGMAPYIQYHPGAGLSLPMAIATALIFFAMMGILQDLVSLPFSIYSTFVVEERFGFNRTTPRIFLLDHLKGYLLAAFLGGPLIALLIFFQAKSGSLAWVLAWGLVSVVILFLNLFYTSLIVPLFNKLTPLSAGPLRSAISEYAKKVSFPLTNILVMDGSKRSSKANAFFSGLGKQKKIVLFDTLMEKHSTGEIVAILAHETGHYMKKHIPISMALSILQTGLVIFLFFYSLNSPDIAMALGGSGPSFHLGMIGFFYLFAPLSLVMSLFFGFFSRRNEYQADQFAAKTASREDMKSALRRLSIENLTNPHPHPLYVLFHYSHPPVAQRLSALDRPAD